MLAEPVTTMAEVGARCSMAVVLWGVRWTSSVQTPLCVRWQVLALACAELGLSGEAQQALGLRHEATGWVNLHTTYALARLPPGGASLLLERAPAGDSAGACA